MNRFLLAQLVRQLNCSVFEAEGGVQALELLTRESIDVILLDIDMPDLDGFAVLERLKNLPGVSHIPVIMVSSLDDMQSVVRCIELGAADFLMKPFEPTVLRARLLACLEKKHFLSELLELKGQLERRNRELERVNRELAGLNGRLEELAFTDVLTGLPNRRYALDTLQRLWAHAQRTAGALTCLLLDIDHFKRVNDTLGHESGDAVIRLVASQMAASVRQDDVACRFGGEEFIVLCPDTEAGGGEQLAQRIRAGIRASAPDFLRGRLPLTVSVGLAQRDDQTESFTQLVNFADRALYQAKREGRDRVCRYSP